MPTPSALLNLIEDPSDSSLGSTLKREILPRWLPERRWFRSKTRAIRSVGFEAAIPLESVAVLCVVRLEFTDGETEDYLLPLALETPINAETLPVAARITSVDTADGESMLIDGCWHPAFRTALYARLLNTNPVTVQTEGLIEVLRGRPVSSAAFVFAAHTGSLTASRVLSAEQSNTSIVYGTGHDAVFVKLYRKLEAGIHPEPEMLRFLREQTAYRNVPEYFSALEWNSPQATRTTLALAQEFLPNGIDAWEHVLASLRAASDLLDGSVPDDLLALVGRMGRRVGELHAALGSRADLPDFAPEPFTAADDAILRGETRTRLEETLGRLADENHAMPAETAAAARTVLEQGDALRRILEPAADQNSAGFKTRTHGDLHLGQMLVERDDLRILDFEGEPGRPLQAARVKRSPLRDVAGMLRSFHYATYVIGRERGPDRSDLQSLRLGESFLAGYFSTVDSAKLLPVQYGERRKLLGLFLLEKALYELQYEWNNRPDWAVIPLRGLQAISSAITNR